MIPAACPLGPRIPGAMNLNFSYGSELRVIVPQDMSPTYQVHLLTQWITSALRSRSHVATCLVNTENPEKTTAFLSLHTGQLAFWLRALWAILRL